MAAAADPRAAKQPSSHPLPRPAFPIPAKWGHRRSPHHRADSRRNTNGAVFFGARTPPPAPDSGRRTLLLPLPAFPPTHVRVDQMTVNCGRGGLGSGGGDEDAGLEELRAKLIREAADRIGGVAVSPAEPAPPSSQPAEAAAAASMRPWNLRSRWRGNSSATPAAAAERGQRTSRVRSAEQAAAAAAEEEEKKKKRAWPEIAITLTPEEIEEDIYAMTGSRPRRRPKKRPRAVQRQLDSVFPGLCLPEITAESYKVEDES